MGGHLERAQVITRSPKEVFEFFAEPANLATITPPWLGFRIVNRAPLTMGVGLLIEYRVAPLLGIPMRWVSEITEWNPPHSFVDEQRAGPYRRWRHRHQFCEVPGGVEVRDTVDYELPLGPVGRWLAPWLVRPRLERIFEYRTEVIAARFA